MEINNTKDKILEAALELFSTNGFEATSVGDIAKAVGIRTPSLYSHFEGKQAIFDALIQKLEELFEKRSTLGAADWENQGQDQGASPRMTPEEAADRVIAQIRFLVHDPDISRTRKMLTIEQYRNPQLARIQEKRVYTDVMDYHTGLMRFLIRQGILMAEDPELMAQQYCAPVSMQLYRIDRDPSCEEEALAMIRRHILLFYRMYGIHHRGAEQEDRK